MKILLRYTDKDYFVVTRKLKTNSNYTIGIHLYEEDVKPRNLLSGTTLKNTSKQDDFIAWGIKQIQNYYQ